MAALLKIFISVILGFSSLEVALSEDSGCQLYSATFIASSEATLDIPSTASYILDDPKLTFFKDRLKFRENAIQHAIADTIQFFNETYGLDFSLSGPNEQNEYFFENAKLHPYYVSDENERMVYLNNWIKTGRTGSTCYTIHDGGFVVTFSGPQTLHGSYGGEVGKPAGPSEAMVYAFRYIDVGQTSPVIMQFQNASPFRREPIDGFNVVNFDVYNRVLGYGKIEGFYTITPHPDEPGRYRYVSRQITTFPAQQTYSCTHNDV